MSRVSIFGLGYVGCVSAACLARDGHQVVGVDINQDKVELLKRGQPTVLEPGLEDLLAKIHEQRRLSATTSLAEALSQTDIAMITVGTPSSADGEVDYRAVEQILMEIGRYLAEMDREYVVVVRSTLLPGILEERLAPAFDRACGGKLGRKVRLCNNPEFLRESTAIHDYDHPPFVLIGCDQRDAGAQVASLYDRIPADKIITDTRTASMVKYASNAYHALKIAFANEIGVLSSSFQIDGQAVMQLVCRDKQLNISSAYLRPGFAFGGSCLPKDLRALTRYAQQKALSVHVLSAIMPSNDAHLQRALAMIQGFNRRNLGLIGLSFKANTDDLRESPLVHLAETLLGRGYHIKIYDPNVRIVRLIGRNRYYIDEHLPHLSSLLVDNLETLSQHADLLLLGNDSADQIPWQSSYRGPVIDLRRDLVVSLNQRTRTP